MRLRAFTIGIEVDDAIHNAENIDIRLRNALPPIPNVVGVVLRVADGGAADVGFWDVTSGRSGRGTQVTGMDVAQPLVGDVSVDLRGGHAFMAEHFLHSAQVGAARKQGGGI